MASDEEYRRHMRIREETPISWRIEGSGLTGQGSIRDISVSGVLLEIDASFSLDKGSIFILQPAQGEDDLIIPDKAKLIWSKPMKMEKGKYLCGLEFIKPSDSIILSIAQRVENWFSRLAEASDVNVLKNYFKEKK